MEQSVEGSTSSTASLGPATPPIALDRIFPGDSDMAQLMRSMDWSRTPLGPVDGWPQSLRTVLSVCLASRFPILIWWGRELAMLYNDAYRDIIATKHPQATGAPGRVIFPEIWQLIGPMLEGVLTQGKATWSNDQLLCLDRNGYAEECYFTFSYSPIHAESGDVGGVFCAVTETTPRVLGERRTRAARDLAASVVDARTADEVCTRAIRALVSDPNDVPFALLYLLDGEDGAAHLVASAGLAEESPFAPASVCLDPSRTRREPADSGETFRWPLADVARTGQREVVTSLPTWPGKQPVSLDGSARLLAPRAVLLPVIEPGQAAPSAILVAGVNPLREWDEEYDGFYQLLASHLASALASAHAYEEERKRAEALAEIDRAKTSFFSNISHEFRTPLTLMLGPLADSLSDTSEPLPPRQQDRIEVAQRNGVRLLKLVNTLLDFSRIEAGRAQASYQPIDLAAFTAELASAFRSLVEKAGLALVVECPPLDALPAPVYVDREMWEKVVLNLLSNAFKYTFDGAITVSVRPVDAGAAVLLEVRDTGVGIPADELPRLFERFHRVEGARARTHEGSGIGLALVQELAHLHGGTIWVESVEGEGTSVFVRVPTGAAHLPAEHIQARLSLASTTLGAEPYVLEAGRWLPDDLDSPASPSAAAVLDAPEIPSPTPGDGRRARIVLADDNADMRDYLRRLLSEHYEVEAVGNGSAALDVIARRPPDLVLADVMMPELDGLQLLAALRSNPGTRAVPVILLSARAGVEATAEGLRAGADDYLVKPFSTRDVLSRVAARLEMARLRNEAQARAQELERVIATISDGVAVYDREGRIMTGNAAWRRLAARVIGEENVRGTLAERGAHAIFLDSDGRSLPPERWPQSRILAGETLAGPTAADVAFDTPRGRLYFSLTGAPLRGPDGQVTGMVLITRDVTERRRLERDARLHSDMLERAHDAIFLWELGGPITFWNRGAELLYGFSREEAVGKVSHDLLQTVRSISAREFEENLERDGEWTGELVHTTRDGRPVTVLSRHQVLREPDGRRYVLETSRDITDRLALERTVRESAARLRAILDLLPVGAAFVDTTGKAVLVNRELLAIWGEQTPFAQSVHDYGQYKAWRPETGQPVAAEEWGIARALSAGEVSLGVEYDIETFDGKRKTILDSDAPLRDESGAIVGAMSVLVDITERKRLERRTHEALAALLGMAEALTGAPLASGRVQTARDDIRRVLGLTQRVLEAQYVGAAYVDSATGAFDVIAVTGLTPEIERQLRRDLAHRGMADYYPPEALDQLNAGEMVSFDFRAAEPPISGQDYFGLSNVLIVPFRVDPGRILILAAEARDRASFTPQERALARAAVRLVALVVERDRLQREGAESEARELAAIEAQRRMDDFLGIASHELRTPLTSITANVQMAERTLRPLVADAGTGPREHSDDGKLDRAYLLLERTDRQVKRLDRLVGDLLDASRIQAGKLELRPEPCDLLPIVREAVEEQRAAWPNRALALELPRRATLPILADGDRIGQVVTNYLTNALKYSASEQPVQVRVRVRDGVARVAVRDQGPGISPAQQRRLFERFYRAPGIEQQSGSGVGLGLGLHICKTIVERHGGQVGVHSVPGKGSTFWFTLPIIDSAEGGLMETEAGTEAEATVSAEPNGHFDAIDDGE